MSGTIAITMAGRGSRFLKAGYTRPKYEIKVGGRYLFDWSMLGLSAFLAQGWTFQFAARAEEQPMAFLTERCAALGIQMGDVVELDGMTDGQATTARLLAERADPDAPFAVFNIDTFVTPGAMRPDLIPAGASGWVPCFPGVGDGWSFARADENGRILELREKVRISDDATVGFYHFSSAALYLDVYADFFVGGAGEEKGERYIAPMYNYLIERGDLVAIGRIAFDDVGMLGTPEQVDNFRADPPAGARAYLIEV